MTIVCVTGGDGEPLRSIPIPAEIAARFAAAAGATA
jgi:hypothetical protein